MRKRPDLSARNTTHNLSGTRAYKVWKDMRARCYNPNNKRYDRYGGRGIAVCDRWASFAAFYEDMGDRPGDLTIERVNRDDDYYPANCMWADKYQQANNRSNNHVIEHNGVSKTLQQWCNQYGVDQSKARYRLSRGYEFETVFSRADLRK